MANTTGRKFGGRKKGTPNKDTKQIRERINTLLDMQWETIIKDFEALEPKERIDAYTKLLEYALPKLRRTELTGDTDINFTPIQIVFNDKPQLDDDTDKQL